MKKSFTLIEVLVATLIVFLVVNAVYQSISNYKFLIHSLKDYRNFVLASSIVFIEKKERKNLYENLIDFNITNDEIIKNLKKYTIKLEIIKDFSHDYNLSGKKINFYIHKLKAYNKFHSTYIYDLGIK